MKRRKGELRDFASIAGSVIRRMDPGGKVEEARVISRWEDVAGEEIARHTRGFSLEKGVLLVFVDSNTWANELSLMGEALKDSLNEAIGEEAVTSIRFAASQRAKGTQAERARQGGAAQRSRPAKRELSDSERRRIRESAAVIEHEGSREAAETLMRKALERGSSQGHDGPRGEGG